MKKFIVFLFTILSTLSFSENNYLGTQTLYVEKPGTQTPAPEGFKPFYINHLGRHGARYLSKAKYIDYLKDTLIDAKLKGFRTSKGDELFSRLNDLENFEKEHYGLLSNVGKTMEFQIGDRAYNNFPDIFTQDKKVYANATYVKRTQESMDAFLTTFKEKLPTKNIKTSINDVEDPVLRFFDLNKIYLDFKESGKWKKKLKTFEDRSKIYEKITNQFFDEKYTLSSKDKLKFASTLYKVYGNQFDVDHDVKLGDYFNKETLEYFWENENAETFLAKGPGLKGTTLPTNIAFPLLKDFIKTSDKAIKDRSIAANFRFAHAETLIPFASLLKISFASKQVSKVEDIKNVFKDYEVSPMGANIQWIFYSNNKNEILVKMLYNEQEIEFPIESKTKPYYKWNDVKKYYNNRLKNLKIKKYKTLKSEVKYYKGI